MGEQVLAVNSKIIDIGAVGGAEVLNGDPALLGSDNRMAPADAFAFDRNATSAIPAEEEFVGVQEKARVNVLKLAPAGRFDVE